MRIAVFDYVKNVYDCGNQKIHVSVPVMPSK